MNTIDFDPSRKEAASAPTRSVPCLKEHTYRVFCLLLAITLILVLMPHLAWGDEASGSSDSESRTASHSFKDEVVYIKATADGNTEGVYVVNIFPATEEASGTSSVTDAGSYEKVVNLSTNETLSQNDDGIVLTPLADEPFYYEGVLSPDTTLPWTVTVSYTLNGKSVTADELVGASGEVEISLSIEPQANNDFAEHLLLMAQGTFDADHFSIEDSGNATIARAGSNEVATVIALPGDSVNVTLSGTAHNFSYDGWQISAMELSSAIDVADKDTSALNEAVQELEDAVTELDRGATSLLEGNSQLAQGAHSAENGTRALAEGMKNLSSAGSELEHGWNEVNTGIANVQTGAENLAAGALTYKSTLQGSLDPSANTTYQKAQAVYEQALNEVMAAYGADGTGSPTPSQIEALNTAAQNLATASGNAGANQALGQALSGFTDIEKGAKGLSSGTKELATGATTFEAGLHSYLSGTDEAGAKTQELHDGTTSLASGADDAESGARELSNGLGELSEAVNDMDDDILEELQNMIDELLGSGFDLHSFVAPENTQVNSVQFIYVVEGIDEPENDNEVEVVEENDQSIWDRFLALFS